jgi:hypothetical protein
MCFVNRALLCALAAASLSSSVVTRAAGEQNAPAGMFELYAKNRQEGIPNLITQDFLLLAYSMVLQNEIERIEEGLQDDVGQLVEGLSAALAKQDAKERGTDRAQAFAATLVALRKPDPGEVPQAVADELKLISAGAGISTSAITGLPVDFSQMTPRGRYTRNEDASRYFRVVRYAGSVLFPLRGSAATQTSEEQATELTAAAVTMSRAISGDPALAAVFKRIGARTQWLFGRADDLTVTDYAPAVRRVGAKATPATMRKFLAKTFAARRPHVIGGAVATESLESGVDARDVLLGWRLLPQRVTPDRIALQKLVYGGSGKDLVYNGSGEPRSVTTVAGVGRVRGFPLADDLLALLGSAAAKERLQKNGEVQYSGYEKAFADARRALAGENGLAADHLRIVRALSTPAGADSDVRLNTAAALWTLDKHREVLYAKQSYTGVGKSVQVEQRDGAWLDPAVDTYVALRQQLDRIAANVAPASDSLARFGKVLDRCIEISRQEINGVRPSGEAVTFLNDLDGVLRELVGRDDGPVATDVHTDGNSGMTLVEALAAPTVVEATIGENVMRGALFTHVEFRHPISERLTDQQWAERVAAGIPEAAAVSERLGEAFARHVAAYAETK